MKFIDLGARNKGLLWEYSASEDFRDTKLPMTAFTIPSHLGVGRGAPNKHCHDEENFERFKTLFPKELEAGVYTPEFFASLKAVYDIPIKELEETVNSNTTSITNQQLADIVDFACRAIMATHTPMLMGLYTMYLEDYFKDKLAQVLTESERTQENMTRFTSILLTTNKPSFGQLEEESLYDIEQEFWGKNSEFSSESFDSFVEDSATREKLDRLTEKFGWFHMEYAYEPYVRADYIHNLRERLSAGKAEHVVSPIALREEIMQEQQEFFAEHPDDSFKSLVFSLQEFAFILDDSKVATVRGIFLARPLLTEAARRLGISYNDILMLTRPEIIGLLTRGEKADPARIEARRRCRVTLLLHGVITVYGGDEAETVAKQYLTEEYVAQNIKEFKGVIGCPGKVTGKVTLVSSVNDKDKFRKGDILVTHDGTAELTTFLREASGIVTDQGGMICHSAIIAREMRTPAVVGTKIATKVLKDGDMVEIDADKGIVRILTV